MTTTEDFWAEEDFEDRVASVLIAAFEAKVKKNRGAHPVNRLTHDRVQSIRNGGPYIPSNSRIFDISFVFEGGHPKFDTINDPIPQHGCVVVRSGYEFASEAQYDGHVQIVHFKKVDSLSGNWYRRDGGLLYEATVAVAENDGINGERIFFTVSKDGEVKCCGMSHLRGPRNGFSGLEVDSIYRARENNAAFALMAQADKRFCWTITAQEREAKAVLGCMQEEVKSLLYARSLPMTATGRKRPILHLVEAHKRRMKSGTEIDIQPFLRGEQAVEIDGTKFTVNPPKVLRPSVSEGSQNRYFRD